MKNKTIPTIILAAATSLASAQTFSFSTAKRGALLGDRHYGIFYEEINHAGDGGLYAELIRNREMEDNSSNPDGWWPIGNAKQSISTSTPLNQWQPNCMKLILSGSGDGTRNEGFWGINVVKDREYKVSFWIRTLNSWNGSLTLRLESNGGTPLGETVVPIKEAADSEWTKYTATIKATGTDANGWFAIRGSKAGTIYLDVVSLFPPTYKNRENGMRPDLAEMLANLHPRFMRFPGGCYIEGGNRYQWKNTVGPIECRTGLHNSHWGYPVSNGMGFHEFLQFCEDINAEPLFVVNVGIGHGWYQDYKNLGDYIQEALDALEYANGPIDSPWGKLRAEMGHPEPFNLRMLEIGNENYNFNMGNNSDQSDHYPERYYQFYQAIKAEYPYVECIGNVESWGTDNPSWRNPYPVDLVDEHYYRDPDWFAARYNKYDSYSRTSHGIYVGEYAVTSDFGGGNGNLRTALGEAIYMAGMEVNSDVVRMTSYAPIFCNEGNGATQWVPDMLHFNSSASFGTPSYWAQQMMAAHVGHQNLTWTEQGNSADVRGGNFALSSWSTTVKYDNIKITDSQGNTVYATDFSDADEYATMWHTEGGTWALQDGALVQSDAAMQGLCNVLSVPTTDCTIELDATKLSGAEGFLIAFGYQDKANYTWWNIGGWNNSQHAVEQSLNGSKKTLAKASGTITTGTTYHLKIVRSSNTAKCYIDDRLIHEVTLDESGRQLYLCASITEDNSEAIVKIINYASTSHDIMLQFDDASISGDAKSYIMTSASNMDQNTMAEPRKVVPVEGTVRKGTESDRLPFAVKPYSLNILHIPLSDAKTPTEPTVQIPEPVWEIDFQSSQFSDNQGRLQADMKGGSRLLTLDDGNIAFYTGRNDETGHAAFDVPSAQYMASIVNTRQFSVSMNILIEDPANFGSFCWALALGTDTDNYFGIINNPNNGDWFAETKANGSLFTVRSGSGLSQNRWHNIVYTQDDSTARIYIDGQLRSEKTTSSTAALSTSSTIAYIARSFFGSDAYMAGTWFDDIKIFNRSLTAEEAWVMGSKINHESVSSQHHSLYSTFDELFSLREAATKLDSEALAPAIAAATAALSDYKSERTDTQAALAILADALSTLRQAMTDYRDASIHEHATATPPFDITFLVQNADFSDGKNGWQGTDLTAAPGTVAEQFWKLFDTYQTLSNMPAGTYELHIRGFYRNGSKESAYRAHTSQTENLMAEYYLRSSEGIEICAPFLSLYDENTTYTYYNYPDNVTEADNAFHTKKFFDNAPIQLTLSEVADLTLGLRKNTYVPRDWTCFDDVRLYYYPSDPSSIQHIDASTIRIHRLGIFDLGGRPLHSVPSHGTYIQDGKVRIEK